MLARSLSFLFAAIVTMTTGLAWAQAPIELSPEADARLESHAIPVIVHLTPPSVGLGEAAASVSLMEARTAAIHEMQENVVQQAFGTSIESLRRERNAVASSIARDEGQPTDRFPDGLMLTRQFDLTPAIALSASRDQIELLAALPQVVAIAEDRFNEPFMDESLPLTGASLLHGEGLTGEGVAVAILDTGTDHQHPMLNNAIVASACFSSYTVETTSRCPNGQVVEIGTEAGDACEWCAVKDSHGTHVAGTVAGRDYTYTDGNNIERTLRGMAPGAGIVAINVFSLHVAENDITALDSDLLAALEWVYSNRVIEIPGGGSVRLAAANMSLGGGRHFDYCPFAAPAGMALQPIISLLRSAGVATVIASGNNHYNDSVSYPACISEAVTVGATDRNDAVTSFSNSAFMVDLLAPGHLIRSSVEVGTTANSVDAYSGTSMATPHVAGAFALLAAAHPEASVNDIETALRLTGRPVTDPDNSLVRTRIDVAQAHEYMSAVEIATGPLSISPATDYFATVNVHRPQSPDVVTYSLTNDGIESMTVSIAVEGIDAVTFGADVRAYDVELAPGTSTPINIVLDLAAVTLGEQRGEITIEAEWPGGEQRLDIGARVLGYAGASPSERPFNDDFADALVLRDNFQVIELSSFGATRQAGEPAHDGEAAENTTWYRLTFQRDGMVRIGASGRLGRNTLAVYRGTSLAALETVAAGSATHESVSIDIAGSEGETVHIAFDYAPPENSMGGQERDPFSLFIIPLAGPYDAFADALELEAPNGRALVSLAGSTFESGEPDGLSSATSGTVWLRATGGSGDQLSLVIEQTVSLTIVTPFTGTALDELVAGKVEYANGFDEAEPLLFDIPDGGLWVRLQTIASTSDPILQGEVLLRWQIGSDPAEASVNSAVAPMVRTAQLGNFASGLLAASVGGSVNAADCGIRPPLGGRGVFTFMPLTPEAGGAGEAVDIPAGQSQIFAFGGTITGGAPAADIDGTVILPMLASCANGSASRPTQLNSVLVTLSTQPIADIVAVLAATTGNVVEVPENGAARFSVAASNLGVTSGPVYIIPFATNSEDASEMAFAISDAAISVVEGIDGFPTLPLTLSICSTDADDGTCLDDFAASRSVSAFASGGSATFTVRVQGQGESVDLSPGVNRVGVAFVEVSSLDSDEIESIRLIGAGSIAVRTVPD
ncbi:S8 family peptidase [Hyphobacterium sp.]|uniref:S8 family peptidase n=1 Tax=Hyphobacterium sp. TaxID=2004662 RepID=UPI003B519E09